MPESDSRWEQTDLLSLSLVTPDSAPPPAAAEPLQPVAEREAESAAAAENQTVVALAPEARPDAGAAAEASAGPSAPCVDLPSFTSAARSLPACPQRLLILDTETTGLSPNAGQCIEVGAVLFHVPSRSVLTQVSFLLPCPSNPAQVVNGIDAAVSRLPQPWQEGLRCFEAMVASADALVAHNVPFDRQWFGLGALPPLQAPWICTMEDIRWPAERQLRPTPSLRDLALAYGVPVWAAHRALTDCLYLVQVFERCDELEELLQVALEPRRLYRARLSYAERHRAKEAGFRWNDPVQGAWTRRLSQRELEALTFPVQAVEADEEAA
jgi:DNA polymerase-3 subunit epsilon